MAAKKSRNEQPPARHRRPTEAELSILGVIWQHGPSTVRQVHEHLSSRQDVGPTTILKLMQIMTEKGLLTKDDAVRPQVYSASQPRTRTQKQLVGDLLERAFSGSPGGLVLQALELGRSSPEELRQIRELLDRMEAGGEHRPEPRPNLESSR